MISSKELETRKCVSNNKNLFEDVAKSFVNAKDIYKTQYDILNYDMILDQMIEFIDGYKEYEAKDDKKYEGKVLKISQNFYDKMFTDKKYRKKIHLEQFKDINVSYLRKTKELQTIIENYLKDKSISAELNSLIRLTNNQYKKLAKVCRDDMKIYLWLSTSNSKFFAYHLDESTRSAYANKNAPVMHKYIPR
jgi:predicted nucleic-acid-binding protein